MPGRHDDRGRRGRLRRAAGRSPSVLGARGAPDRLPPPRAARETLLSSPGQATSRQPASRGFLVVDARSGTCLNASCARGRRAALTSEVPDVTPWGHRRPRRADRPGARLHEMPITPSLPSVCLRPPKGNPSCTGPPGRQDTLSPRRSQTPRPVRGEPRRSSHDQGPGAAQQVRGR